LEGPRKKADQENSTLCLGAVEAEENAEKEMTDNARLKKKAGQGTKSKPWYRRTKMRASH
jgi:hypothetical protein